MSFAHPFALLILPALGLLLALHLSSPLIRFGLPGGWHRVIAPEIGDYLVERMQGTRSRQIWLFAAIAVLLCLALARPLIDLSERPPSDTLAARVIVLDLPNGTDISEQRLLASRLLDAAPDIATAIVAVAGEAYSIVPVTTDREQIDRYLTVLSAPDLPAPGRAVHTGLAHAEAVLARQSLPVRQIILVTDQPAPTSLVDIARTETQRAVVPINATPDWNGVARHFDAALVAADEIDRLDRDLRHAIDATARSAQPGAALDLTPWCAALAMLLWLTLFRREAEA